jgi:cytochrome c-type biogenesis protein CcmF
MLTDIGYGALALTLVAALYAAGMAFWGGQQRRPALVVSARNALLATAGLTTLATVMLLVLLLRREFQVEYVAAHVSSYLPLEYVLSALWAGLEGSQLLWLWLLAMCTLPVVLSRASWDRELRPYVLAVLAVAQAFFALLLLLVSNPFALLPFTPVDGQGLNPLLENVWMIVHPPVVFVAYAAWTVPFAYAMAALVTGRLDAGWLKGVRRWTLFSWVTLGMGILIGALWAYVELGWGGYWGWDPVENSSLIPWLVGTAFVHSAVIQERREMFRAWSVGLVSLTFLLCVFATFVTRSGLIQSVHAFAESPIGYYYLGFMLFWLAATVGLMVARSAQLKGKGQVGDLLSREFAFLLANLLLLGFAAAVLLGTLWPTLSGGGSGLGAQLDPEGYDRIAGPLGMALVVLIGVCPLVSWRRVRATRLLRKLWVQVLVAAVTALLLVILGIREWWAIVSFAVSAFVGATFVVVVGTGVVSRVRRKGENPVQALGRDLVRNHRRYGAQLVHLGIVLIVVGITGSKAFQSEVQVALAKGESVEVSRYTVQYRDAQSEQLVDKQRFWATVGISRNGRLVAEMQPEKNFHWNIEQWVTEVAIHPTLAEDLYVILGSVEEDGLATFQILVNPLVVWLWIGGVVLLLGTVVAAWPDRPRQRPGGGR